MGHKRIISLDEETYAINVLTNGEKASLDKSIMQDLSVAARYLYQKKNQKPKEIIEALSSLLRHRDKTYSVTKWEKHLESITNIDNLNDKLFVSDGINITQKELDAISEIDSMPKRRVAFTMLCLAKYNNQKTGTDRNNIFFDLTRIFTLSNTAMTFNQKLDVLRELLDRNIIDHVNGNPSVYGYSVKIVDDQSNTVYCVTEMKDLGYQYEELQGVKFARCKLCGSLIRVRGREEPKYCNSCITKYHLVNSDQKKKSRLCIVKCIDCGQNFMVDPRAFGIKQRCDNCQKIARRKADTERKYRTRHQQSASLIQINS